MKDFMKAVGLEGPFRTTASVVVTIGVISLIIKVIQTLQNSGESSNMLVVLSSILDNTLSMAISLLTALFFIVAIQYLAGRANSR